VPFRKRLRPLCLLALCAVGLSALVSCEHARSGAAASRKMIILGIDGLDPDLLTKFMPRARCRTSRGWPRRDRFGVDDQHPAAKPGGVVEPDHGNECRRPRDFDFIHRDPKTFQLYFFDLESRRAEHSFHLGSWVIPLGSGSAEQLRHARRSGRSGRTERA